MKQLFVYAIFFVLQVDENCCAFPKHFEARFAEHTLNVLKAVLHNKEAAQILWKQMSKGTITSDKKEKSMAEGFLKKWHKGSRQVCTVAKML